MSIRIPLTIAILSAGPVLADGNQATTVQVGIGNAAAILQQGTGLTAGTWQGGANNSASTSQSGNGHFAAIAQVGQNHSETVVQAGSGPTYAVSIGLGNGQGTQGASTSHTLGALGQVQFDLLVGR